MEKPIKLRPAVALPAVAAAGMQVPPNDVARPYTDEEIKVAFDTFDLDKNRFVGASEIRHVLSLIGEAATDEEIDEMVRMCDADGDGQVTFDEFRKMILQPQMDILPKPIQPFKQERGLELDKQLEQDENAPAYLDLTLDQLMEHYMGGKKLNASFIKNAYKSVKNVVKGTGDICYEDFCEVMQRPDSPMMDALFRAFDLDNSGSLELKEFLVVLSMYTTTTQSDKLKFSFMMYDEDGSGFLERAEFIELLRANFHADIHKPDNMAAIEQKVSDIFASVFQPLDGRISYDDFIDISRSHPGLLCPVVQPIHVMNEKVSIDKLLKKEGDKQ